MSKEIFKLVQDDVDEVVNGMKEFYEKCIESDDFNVSEKERYEKALSFLNSSNQEDIYDFVKRKLELPWYEHIECAIECLIDSKNQ